MDSNLEGLAFSRTVEASNSAVARLEGVPSRTLLLDLIVLNQLTDAERIPLAMAVAGDGISASG